MPVDKVELAKDLETPEYQALIKETLAKKEFVIHDKTEHQSYLDRYKTDVIEKEIPNRVKAIHDQYDKDVKELTGIDRDLTNEKSYDYVKRAFKTKLADADTYTKKIADLEEKIKSGDPSGIYKKQLEEAENKYKTQLELKEKELNGLKQQSSVLARRSAAESELSKLRASFKKDLPAMFSRIEKSVLDEAINKISIKEDGRAVILKDDGTVLKDSAFNEVTLESYLKNEFKDVIDTGAGGSGAGSKNPAGGGGPDPSTITVDTFVMDPKITRQGELMDYMLSLGLKRGDKTFNAIYKKFSVNLKF
jgi:hypothetical protein